ncbi:TRAP transporter substrate-binding protein [Salisediminibacterium beveridgei]|uniref:TRAP-type C4-dicarboxylate transport system, periplasmic component n=1 Tax=Salisediminibacterium beveridgei TaxID=632773 RepID=A0A1D7QR88_9BACI|nr:TRAP transporter substrate-binding protein [Salisediminibacterium beveridgei]AOM81532.1 TRAP-type C4-dicarboxylate transport system, periplasmic component [Salisediminibacterium beveridgei]
MKKQISMISSVVGVSALLVACGDNENNAGNDQEPNDTGADNTVNEENNNDNANETADADHEFEEMVLQLGHTSPTSDDAQYHQGALALAEYVEDETDGAVTIEIFPNSELGGEREMLESLQLGNLDMTFFSSGPLGNFADMANVFDFPFLFRDEDHAHAVLDGEIGDMVNEQAQESDIKILAWGENGFRHITNSERPVVTPEDLEGLDIRTMENEIHLSAFSAFGANPTPMAFPELFTALQTGVMDGQENPLSAIVPNSFYDVQSHITLSNHVYSPAPFIINEQIFNGFSPELQEVIQEGAYHARDFNRQFIQDWNEDYLETAIENGMEVVENDEFDYDAYFEATQEVYDEYQDEYGELFEQIQEVE